MRFRKILAFILAFAMIAQSSGISVFATGDPTITVTSASGNIDSIVDVDVNISNNPGFVGMKLTVSYDPQLELVSVSDPGTVSGAKFKPEMTNPYTLSWENDSSADIKTNGTIATLSFRIKDTAANAGKYTVSVSYDKSAKDIVNAAGKTVDFVCKNGQISVNCSHASKTEVPAKGADCVNPGNIRYFVCDDCHALFTPDDQKTTAADVFVPALGHDYGEASCTEEAVCSRCGNPKSGALGHSFTAKIEDELHLKTAAKDCTEKNVYWYGCERCSEISTTLSYSGSTFGPHDFTEKIEDEAHVVPGTGSDCQHPYMYYFDCSKCSTIGEESFTSAKVGDHSFSAEWITKDGKHFHKCTILGCEAIADEAVCSGGTATCTEKAACAICNQEYGELAPHAFSSTWKTDATGHWHVCKECNEIGEFAAHTPDREEPTETNPVKCTVCGYVMRSNTTKIVVSAPTTDILSAKSIQLEATFDPSNKTGTDIIWRMKEGDEVFASVNGLGKLTAKAVYELHEVTVYAEAKDGSAIRGEIKIAIHPLVSVVNLIQNHRNVTGTTMEIDVNTATSLVFTADNLPAGAMSGYSWKISDTKGAYCTLADNGNGKCTVSNFKLPNNKAVTVTLTAKALDGSNKTASVKLHLVGIAQSAAIVGDASTAANPKLLRGGASHNYVAELSAYSDVITDKSVIWKLEDPRYASFASISSTGKLTTVPVTEPVDIVISVRAKANASAIDYAYVRLCPAAYSVSISCATHPIVDGVISVNYNSTTSIKLVGSVAPVEAIQAGTWKSSNNSVAVVDASGSVSFKKVGSAVIAFTAADGSGKTASVKVNVGIPVSSVTLSGNNAIQSGGKTTITAAVNADATNKKLAWYTDRPSVASVSSKGVVTAKTVYQEEIVTVYAVAQDGSELFGSMKIAVSPKSNVLAVLYKGTPVNGKTMYVDITEASLPLSAPAGSIWSSSNKSVATVDENGGVSYNKQGTVTITAKSPDGKRVGKVTLKISVLVKTVTVTTKAGDTEATIGAGKGKVNLVAKITPSNATVKSLSWVSSNPAVAAVSSSGVVTAKANIHSTEIVYIRALPKDGSGNYGEFPVTVVPAANTVNILSAANIITQDMLSISADEILNNRTLKFDVEKVKEIDLDSRVLPNDAFQDIVWKSSNSSVAKIDENGVVKFLGTGAVTITAAAQDGSNKSASVKLDLVRYAKKIEVTNTLPILIGSGSKVTLSYKLVTNSLLAPTSKAVTFSVHPDDTAYASVSSSGVVTGKPVSVANKARIIIASKDDPSVNTTVTVTVAPKATSMNVVFDGKIITGQTLNASIGHPVKLGVSVTPYDACQNVKWSVSNTSIAEIKPDGSIVGLKAGTVTVTAKLQDGSGKTASVKLSFK